MLGSDEVGPATRAPAVPGLGLSAGGSSVGGSGSPFPPPPPATPAAAAAARRRSGVSSEGIVSRASYAAMRASVMAQARSLARAALARRALSSLMYAALGRPPLGGSWVAGGGWRVAGGGLGLRGVGLRVVGLGRGLVGVRDWVRRRTWAWVVGAGEYSTVRVDVG